MQRSETHESSLRAGAPETASPRWRVPGGDELVLRGLFDLSTNWDNVLSYGNSGFTPHGRFVGSLPGTDGRHEHVIRR
nr:hypothetical protein [Kibdelosporangium sp. MJ126-NF4]CTQ88834.1 hypothetical protein [Kibdelosporangium sp. MJ126-NF4]